MKCENPECEDGWINVRNMTVPPRPCLALGCPFGTKLIQVPVTGQASHGVVIGDQPDRYPTPTDADALITRTLTEQSRRHAEVIRDLSRSTRIVVRALDNEIERLARLVKQARPFVAVAKERGDFESLCPACGRYWEEDASNCADDCSRKTWLKETSEDKP